MYHEDPFIALSRIAAKAEREIGAKFVKSQRLALRHQKIRDAAIADAYKAGAMRKDIAAAFKLDGRTISDIFRKYRNENNYTHKPRHNGIGDITGNVYGLLTVVDGLYSECHCVCACGNTVKASKHSLVHGYRKSCGCLQSRCGGAGAPGTPLGMTLEQVEWARGVFRDGPSCDRAEAGLILLFYHEFRLNRKRQYHSENAPEYYKIQREKAAASKEMQQ